MKANIVFFRYAFPCSSDLYALNKIRLDDYNLMNVLYRSGKAPEKEKLEKLFPNAIARIKKLAEELGEKDYWREHIIRDYFINRHNKVIDNNEGLYSNPYYDEKLKNLCKVHIAEINEIKKGQESLYVVSFDGQKRSVIDIGPFVPDAKKGDKVVIHSRFVVEKYDENLLLRK